MTKKNIYKGISFVNYKNNKTLSLSDIDLVKQDLLNHIFTIRGERIMLPTFGTGVSDMPFEQLDELTITRFEDDLLTVVNYDPRVELRTEGNIPNGINVIPLYDENALIGVLDLNYIELDISDTLEIRLDFNI